MHYIKSSCVFLLLAMLFTACKIDPPRYGTWFNSTRSEVGLERLPEWYSYSDEHWKEAEVWNNTLCYDTTFCHVQKRTVFNADTILWEEDRYHSSTVYKTIDCDREPEELVKRYHFDTHEWECEWTTARGEADGFIIVTTEPISCDEADSMLREWAMVDLLAHHEPCDFQTGNLIFVTPDTSVPDRPTHVVITECTDSGVYVYDACPGRPMQRVPLETFETGIYTDTTLAFLNYVRFMMIDCQFDTKHLIRQLQYSIGETIDACTLVRLSYRGPKGQPLFTAEDPVSLYQSPLLCGPFRIE